MKISLQFIKYSTEKTLFSPGIFWRMVKRAIAQVRVLRKCTELTAMRSQPMFQNHKYKTDFFLEVLSKYTHNKV
ncbi:hypothetical protein [Cylindrospermopsis raciborskii]|uniref:hypothetical protein n=1 Tax=Cylindrospermopsis raciborskii TaxID=77022 RepID=UPI0022CC3C2C|nr:hypothetical protein [Cylindrospermopsis raciborskii]MCZ2204910.1 hypothetical protein [Cylindrospermopsis raciborskii PAMP2011]